MSKKSTFRPTQVPLSSLPDLPKCRVLTSLELMFLYTEIGLNEVKANNASNNTNDIDFSIVSSNTTSMDLTEATTDLTDATMDFTEATMDFTEATIVQTDLFSALDLTKHDTNTIDMTENDADSLTVHNADSLTDHDADTPSVANDPLLININSLTSKIQPNSRKRLLRRRAENISDSIEKDMADLSFTEQSDVLMQALKNSKTDIYINEKLMKNSRRISRTVDDTISNVWRFWNDNATI